MNSKSRAEAAAPEFPAGGGAVAVLVATALFVLSQLYAAIPLAGPVAVELGSGTAFALSTSFGFSYAAGFLVWGPVSDRFGRKRVMSIALGVLVLATLLCAAARSVPAMAVFRALQGLAASGFAPVALAYLSEAVRPARRVGAIGAMSTAFLVAGIFGQVLASVIVLHSEWTWFFVISGVALAVALGLILLLVREGAPQGPPLSLLGQFGTLARLFLKPEILLLSIAHLTLLLSFVALYSGMGGHLERLGAAASDVVLVRATALPAMFLCLAAGPLSRRLGTLRLARLGFTLAALGMFGASLLSGTLPGLVATSFVYVCGVAVAVPAMIALFGETAAPNRGSGMAVNGFVLFVGASIAPVLGGTVGRFEVLALMLAVLLAVAVLSTGGLSLLRRAGSRA